MADRLWKSEKKKQKKKRNPSPTLKRVETGAAQNQNNTVTGLPLYILFGKKAEGSMTLEAAVVLPLFLFFVLTLGGFTEMIRLHGNIQFAVWNTGREVALYEYVVEDNWNTNVVSMISSLYLKNRIVEQLGEEYLENSPIAGGKAGIYVAAVKKNEMLEITVWYQVKPAGLADAFGKIRMKNVCRIRLWTGYAVSADELPAEIVYVTDTGTVYHRERDCTHLTLAIEEISAGEKAYCTNQWGRKYAACEKCVRGKEPDTVLITREGICFHYSRTCAGLKRTVCAMEYEEAVKKYRECSRCGK